MIKKIIRNKKGIIVSDAIISILVLILFSGIIISLITNIVRESKLMKLHSQELDFLIEVFEYADKIPYDNVDELNLIQYINNKKIEQVKAGTYSSSIYSKYKIQISVEKYNETEGNEEKLDLMKIIKVKVSCTFDGEIYEIESKKIRTRTNQEMDALLNY